MEQEETDQNNSESTSASHRSSTKSRKYREQPYCALHSHIRKYLCKGT